MFNGLKRATNYCLSRKSWPLLYSKLLNNLSQEFLDIQYYEYESTPPADRNLNEFSLLLVMPPGTKEITNHYILVTNKA